MPLAFGEYGPAGNLRITAIRRPRFTSRRQGCGGQSGFTRQRAEYQWRAKTHRVDPRVYRTVIYSGSITAGMVAGAIASVEDPSEPGNRLQPRRMVAVKPHGPKAQYGSSLEIRKLLYATDPGNKGPHRAAAGSCAKLGNTDAMPASNERLHEPDGAVGVRRSTVPQAQEANLQLRAPRAP
jgi:hypothetical protein